MFGFKKELIKALKNIDCSLGGIENKLTQMTNDTSGIQSKLTQIEASIFDISKAFTNCSENPTTVLDVRDISKI